MTKIEILDVLEPALFDACLFEVKVDSIAKLLGIGRPTLYYYFPSKESLLMELLDHSAKKFLPSVEKRILTGDIDAHIDWFAFGWIESRCVIVRSFVMMNEYAWTPLEAVIMRNVKSWLMKMEISANGKFWSFSPQRMELVTYVLVGFAKHAFLRWIENVSKEERAATVAELRKMYFYKH